MAPANRIMLQNVVFDLQHLSRVNDVIISRRYSELFICVQIYDRNYYGKEIFLSDTFVDPFIIKLTLLCKNSNYCVQHTIILQKNLSRTLERSNCYLSDLTYFIYLRHSLHLLSVVIHLNINDRTKAILLK